MKRNKEYLLNLFKQDKEITDKINKIKKDNVYFLVMDEQSYKTTQQNRLFHSLCMLFELSGCSSFENKEQIKEEYKKKVGLYKIDYVESELSEEEFKKLELVLKFNCNDQELHKYKRLLRGGNRERIFSFADATKEQAELCIKLIINDMIKADVLNSSVSNKFNAILEHIKWDG